MTLETAFIFTMSLILLWIKPGPGQAFKITRALNDGFWAAFYVVLGIITACVIFFLIAILGLNFVTQFFDKTGFIFKIIGAAYLLYLGIKSLQNIERGKWEGRSDKSNKKKFIENFPPALFLTLSNPLPIFYFLGIMPTLIPLGNFTIQDILMGAGIIITVGLTVDILLILLVSQVKEILSETKFVRNINIITSIGFILIGLFLIYSALFQSNFSFDLL
jgi:threonine/homoserine/homoserine lactone efflux protein